MLINNIVIFLALNIEKCYFSFNIKVYFYHREIIIKYLE